MTPVFQRPLHRRRQTLRQEAREAVDLEREKKLQRTMLDIKKRYGKNAILKGMDLEDGATAKDRNGFIGRHKYGKI